MDRELQQLLDDATELKRIKSHFFKVDILPTEDETQKLRELSDKGFLTASYLLGVSYFFGINVTINPYEVDFYFQKVTNNKDADKSLLFLIANYYAALGDEWKDKAMLSLNLASNKGHEFAKRMLERMEEDPYIPDSEVC